MALGRQAEESSVPGIVKQKGDNDAITIQIDQQDKLSRATSKRKGMTIQIKDLTYTVPHHKNKKEKLDILRNVSCFLRAGELAALMGPSGSGKSTLLDILAGRKTTGEINGKITFAHREPNQNFLRRYTGYVEQFDTLLPILTVREMLMYTADLKRDHRENRAEKEKVVDHWIDKLALRRCEHTLIGSPLTKGISGGQAKRVNVGIALVSDPRVLFLDEPTSGLDSYTQNEVMTYVRDLCSEGVTLCATIHSPSQYCFQLFHRLVLLVRGQVVYFGPNDTDALDLMHAFNPSTKLLGTDANKINDAEWLTDVVVSMDAEDRGGELAGFYYRSEIAAEMEKEFRELEGEKSSVEDATMKELSVNKSTSVPFWYGLFTLFRFRTLKNYHNVEYLAPRIADKLMISFIVITLYWSLCDDYAVSDTLTTENGEPIVIPVTILSFAFMWTALPAFGAQGYVPSIAMERPLFVRERNDGLYRVITYLVYKVMEELMLATAISIPITLAVFYATQAKGEWVHFWLQYYITLNTGTVIAYFIAAATPNMDAANAALPALMITGAIFMGILIRYDEMPGYWIWYSFINFMRYSWMAHIRNFFDDEFEQGLQPAVQIYELYEVDILSKWAATAISFAFFVFFFVATWITLQFKKYGKR